jgi:dihydrofolate reductase
MKTTPHVLRLDGRAAGPGGDDDMSWIVPHAVTDRAREHMVKVTSAATTALLGRKNYQGFASCRPAVAEDEKAGPRERTFAQWLNAAEKAVFSRTLRQAGWHNSRTAAAGPAETARHPRRQEGGDIIVPASTSVIRNLLQAGELDRPGITLCPELAGGGARLFDDGPIGSSRSLTDMTGTDSGGDLPALRPEAGRITCLKSWSLTGCTLMSGHLIRWPRCSKA